MMLPGFDGERIDGRGPLDTREVTLTYDPFGYGDASVLFCLGNTKVFVAVSLQDGVPPFLRGTNSSWLTAEYAMLPTATRGRSTRESTALQKQGRSVEIARLIGRCLRSVTVLDGLADKTIYIDCDVLQADGGTRVACITAASYALRLAIDRWKRLGSVPSSVYSHPIAALSAGRVNGQLFLDLDQAEDNRAQADVNFVMTRDGDIVEMQGTGETEPITWDDIVRLKQEVSRALVPFFAL